MQFPSYSPKSSFSEDMTCGFLGGAMAGFNAGLWFLPHAGILTLWETAVLCMASGLVTGAFLAAKK
jgi:hypothetical protein